jgi:hypothetical protein
VVYLLCESIKVHNTCSTGIICVVQFPLDIKRSPHIGDPDVIRTQWSRLYWEPARSTLWLDQASLNSTPHRASLSEEQHSQQSSKQQRRQPTSTTVARPSQWWRLYWEPARSTLWLHPASPNSTPHRVVSWIPVWVTCGRFPWKSPTHAKRNTYGEPEEDKTTFKSQHGTKLSKLSEIHLHVRA